MSASRRSSSADAALADRDADARGHDHAVVSLASSSNGSSNASSRRSATSSGPAAERQLFGDHDELVAAEAPERVGAAHDAIESCGDRPEQFVARAVAERVVDGLEVVDVDEQRCHRGAVARAPTSICFARSSISVRFGNPVRASWVAMNSSSPCGGQLLVSSRAFAPEDLAQAYEGDVERQLHHRHARPRKRLRRRLLLGRDSPSTSSTASRQRRHRLVRSFNGTV